MRIAIRADGGIEIGMGHIMRTLVLAHELSKENEVFYVCRKTEVDNQIMQIKNCEKYKNGIMKVLDDGFEVVLISENNLIDEMKNVKADILITDSYDVDEEYFRQTKKMFSKTAYIDDMNLYNFDVDYLINQNVNAKAFFYKTSQNTRLLLGCEYVMLRSEFRNVQNKNINKKVKDILITVGGGDPDYITEKLLSFVKSLDYNFHVVIGPCFDKIDKLIKFQNEKIKLYFNANMSDLMKFCDIAISACGSTLYELSACGVPAIGIITAGNQQAIGNKMDELGVIISIGWHNDLSKSKVIECIQSINNDWNKRKEMSLIAQKIVDGEGAKRIANVLCENDFE